MGRPPETFAERLERMNLTHVTIETTGGKQFRGYMIVQSDHVDIKDTPHGGSVLALIPFDAIASIEPPR